MSRMLAESIGKQMSAVKLVAMPIATIIKPIEDSLWLRKPTENDKLCCSETALLIGCRRCVVESAVSGSAIEDAIPPTSNQLKNERAILLVATTSNKHRSQQGGNKHRSQQGGNKHRGTGEITKHQCCSQNTIAAVSKTSAAVGKSCRSLLSYTSFNR